jgi:hypothetical protein
VLANSSHQRDRIVSPIFATDGSDNLMGITTVAPFTDKVPLYTCGITRAGCPAICAVHVCRHTLIDRLVVGQFPNHFGFGTGMTKHIYKIEYDNVQVVLFQFFKLLYEFLCTG